MVPCTGVSRVTLVPPSSNHYAVAATRRPSDSRDAMLRPRRLLVIEARGHSPRWYGAKNCMLDIRHTRRQRERDADGLAHLTLGELDVPRSTAGLPAHRRQPRTGIEVGAA